MGQPIRVLLADHNPTLRMGLRMNLEHGSDVIVVGEAEEGSDVLGQIAALQPDVVVLDCDLPDLSGPEVAMLAREKGFRTRVLALGASGAEDRVLPMIPAGALGYVLTNEQPEIIVMSIRAIARGAAFFSPAIASQMSKWMDGAQPMRAALSKRELAVLGKIAQGKGNKEIASELGMARRTVEYHVSHLLEKLKLTSRVQVAIWAKEKGLDQECRML